MRRPLTLNKSILWGIAVTGLIAMNRWTEPSIVPKSDALTELSLQGEELVYFYSVDCDECRRTSPLIHRLQSSTSDLEVVRLDQNDPDGYELRTTFNKVYEVYGQRQLSVPTVFLGKRVFLGSANIEKRLRDAVDAWDETPIKPHLLVTKPNPAEARQEIIEKFRTFEAAPVITAALLDGVNPCAISTLIFLLSFLAFVNRRDVLAVGLLFCAGVFVTYTLSGLGIFHALRTLSGFPLVAGCLPAIVAALMIALGLTSLQDWAAAAEGRPIEMELQLPRTIKRAIHGLIRQQTRTRAAGAAAFFLVGALVSLLEFVCTGQVYVPTLMYIASVPGYASKALGWVLLYNLFFCLPLVALVAVAAAGTGSKTLARWFSDHLATGKLLTGLFFLAMGAYFLSQIR